MRYSGFMKTRMAKRLTIFMLLSASLALLLPAAAGPERALVRSLTGSAEVVRGGKTEALRVGSFVNDSDRIRTGRQSQIVVLYKGIEIRLMPETDATLVSLTTPGRPGSVQIQRGFGWFKVTGANDGFQASTPSAIAAVRGTSFAVGHDAKGSTSCVCKGTVATRPAAGGTETPVSAGGSNEYSTAGQLSVHNFKAYFKGLKVDRSFEQEIRRDAKLANCKSCHRMTNVATDNTPDPENY